MLESHYELLEPLGQGGMGTVYRARRRATGEMVAVKVMAEEAAGNSLLRTRFEQEYAAGIRLQHPNLVRVLDCDTQCERPYMAMELVDGQSLGERIKQGGPLPEEEALRIIVQIAGAVREAHRFHLVHRDIKPDNILLNREGQAKLTDLGLVKDLSVDTNLTSAGAGLGTIAYVAPEQFESAKSADIRSDIYSLGATLYHALTGVAPFRGRVNLVILRKKMGNDFPSPSSLIPSLSPHVDRAIRRSLDNCADKRQQSCEEFVASLSDKAVPDEADCGADIAGRGGAGSEGDRQRRKAFRFPVGTPIACGSLANPGVRLRGEMQDVSRTGVQLRLPRRFEPGATLCMDIHNPEGATVLDQRVTIRWVKEVADQEWIFGCGFEREISEEELDGLLGNPGSTVVM
jgi:Protein kinase domain/PilZ domain